MTNLVYEQMSAIVSAVSRWMLVVMMSMHTARPTGTNVNG